MWELELYKNSKGQSPAEIFLESISNFKLKAKIIKDLELLEEFGNKLREPHVKLINDSRGSMFELRTRQSSNISRIFFFYFKEEKIILLNGFIKKKNKTPKVQINLAYKYKKEYEMRCKYEK